MRRPYLAKSIYKDVEDVEVIDALLKEIGTVRLFRVGVLSMSDVVGVHGMVAGKYYSGLTVVLQPIKVYYDKWGLPFIVLNAMCRRQSILLIKDLKIPV